MFDFNLLGYMKWPLLITSIVALSISIERFFFIIINSFFRKIRTKDFIDISKYKNMPKDVRDEIVGIHVMQMKKNYLRGNTILKFIASIAPLEGLLGTVLGIIKSFKAISISSYSSTVLADGLWEAMLTTAFGLCISIPSLVIVFIVNSYCDFTMNNICEKLNFLSLEYSIDNNSNEKI